MGENIYKKGNMKEISVNKKLNRMIRRDMEEGNNLNNGSTNKRKFKVHIKMNKITMKILLKKKKQFQSKILINH